MSILACLLLVYCTLLNGLPCGSFFDCGTDNLCCPDFFLGDVCYDPILYVCADSSAGNVLCGSQNGVFNGACGTVCYDRTQYHCMNDILIQGALLDGTNVTLTPSFEFGAAFTYEAGANFSEPINYVSQIIPFSPPYSSDVRITLNIGNIVNDYYLVVVESVGVVFDALETSVVSNAWLSFTTDNSTAISVSVTSCNETTYSCRLSSLSCYPVDPAPTSNFTLCPCADCQVLNQLNVDGPGVYTVDLGPTAFPLTVTFSPYYDANVAEDFYFSTGVVSVTGITLSYSL